MLDCPNCGHQNPIDVPICLNCASSLLQTCPSCQAKVPIGNNFCGQCGNRLAENPQANKDDASEAFARLSTQENMLRNLRAMMPSSLTSKINLVAPEMAGQRREVTVLFVDMADFSAATNELGSEEIYLALDEMMHYFADVIYKYEGTIDKFTGDGLMALFGIPLNHENDPERAVRASLEMLTALKPLQYRLNEQFNFDLHIRIGINTGLVIAGSLGSEHHMEYTVIGDTVNLASRLESYARPGTILVSFNTYQRSRPIINYKTLPLIDMEDWDQPVKAFRPLSIRIKPGQVRGLPGLQVPMVGRRDDLIQLHQAFDAVRDQGASHIVLCSGEAGMGKTRLVAEFRHSLSEQLVKVHLGTCTSFMRTTPYQLMADLLRNILGISEMDAEELQREALQVHLEGLNLEHRDISPYLLSMLGFNQADPLLEARLKLLDPTMMQRQTHAALRSFLIAQTQLSPVVLIFDDLHWVDQASKDFLVHFCQTLENAPVLLILIARDFSRHDLAKSLHESLMGLTEGPLQISLEPLSTEDSLLLVDQLIQETATVAGRIKHRIVERAGGNPYYTEEIVRILIDRGGISFRDGYWTITSAANKLIEDIPGTLQDIILARFDRLENPVSQTLQRAAVIGRVFPVSLLNTISDESPETLAEYINELEKREFIIDMQAGKGERYAFKHPLLREAIYNTLLKRDLRRLHGEVARSIDESPHWLSGEKNEILAYHYRESANPSDAIPYLMASAENARQRFANEVVVLHYRQALELMKSESVRWDIEIPQAQVGLAEALKYGGDFEEAASIYENQINAFAFDEPDFPPSYPGQEDLTVESIRELADIRAREGDLDLAIQLLQKGLTLLGDMGQEYSPDQWRRLIDRTAWVYFRQGKLEEAFNLADLALFNADTWENQDPITLASLNNTMGGVYWTRSRYIDAIYCVEHSLEIYRNLNYHWGMAIAYTNLGVLNFSMGRWPQAVANLEQADALRSEHGYTPERPTNLTNLGEVLMCMGDHKRSREKFEASLEISRKLGMDIASAYSEIGLSRLATIESDVYGASNHLANAAKLLEASKSQLDDRSAQILIQEALIEEHRGNFDAGLGSANKAYQIAEEAGFAIEKIDALRVIGMLYTGMRRFNLANEKLEKSVELARAQDDRYHLGLALLELGNLYLDWGEIEPPIRRTQFKSANDVINQAIDLFEELGAEFDLHQARKARNRVLMDPSSELTTDIEDEAQVIQVRSQLGLPDGEWHQAIILYLAITPQPGEDPELIFETITLISPTMLDVIRENDGQVIHTPQGITAVFGAPIAQEDDPERAIDTAMKLINFYQEFYNQTKLPVSVSMGITMGKVVAGHVGPGSDAEFIAAGAPTQEARRIAEITPPSKVWVSQNIRNATRHRFEYSPVSSDLVDQDTNLQVFQLEGVREQIRPIRGLIGLKTPFIGRQAELRAMLGLSQNLTGGYGGLIWLEGNPGIGKSRLMREFVEQIPNDNLLVWRGTCSTRTSDRAFYLFSNLLSQALDLQPTFPVSQIYESIDQKLETWPPELQETRPYLQLLVGVQPLGEHGEQLTEMEPEQLRRQTFVAFRKVIATLALQQPLVLILDDLQWIDLISADLMLFLTSLVVTHPVVIVGARRSTETGGAEDVLTRARQMYSEQSIYLSIQPLSSQDCYSLLAEFFESTNLPEPVNDLIVNQSGGNPYFIEEFIRMLVERDYLRVSRGSLEINQFFEIESLTVPSSLETMIRARVDALQEPSRRILQVASVIGRQFSETMLGKISGQNGIPKRLELLQARGMVNPAGEANIWEFSHPLIEVIVYNTVLKAQRMILHERTAQALENQWHGDEAEHAEDLAYHYGQAQVHEKAQYYLLIAGERAAARYANETAIKYFEQAVSLYTDLPNTSPGRRWRIATGLGEVQMFVGNFEASIQALEMEIAHLDEMQLLPTQQAGLYRRLGETLLKQGEPEASVSYFNKAIDIIGPIDQIEPDSYTEAALILERLGWSYFIQADLEQATEIGLQAHSFAEKSTSLGALAKVENLLGGVSYRQGELSQAMLHTQQAMNYWEQMGFSYGVAASLSNLGILEVSSGNWDHALDYFNQSLKLRKDMGDINGVAILYNNLGTLAREKGDMKLAEANFRACLAVAKPFQLAWHSANASMGVAQALFYQDKLGEAQEMLQDGISQAEEISARDLSSEMGRVQAEIYNARGEYEEALRTAEGAAALAGEIGNRLMEAGSWRVAADSLLRQGKPEEAREILRKAWDASAEADDEVETGRIHAQARAIHIEMGDAEGAQSHYEVAEEIFSRLGAARDLDLLKTHS